jgi:hypothetical protein
MRGCGGASALHTERVRERLRAGVGGSGYACIRVGECCPARLREYAVERSCGGNAWYSGSPRWRAAAGNKPGASRQAAARLVWSSCRLPAPRLCQEQAKRKPARASSGPAAHACFRDGSSGTTAYSLQVSVALFLSWLYIASAAFRHCIPWVDGPQAQRQSPPPVRCKPESRDSHSMPNKPHKTVCARAWSRRPSVEDRHVLPIFDWPHGRGPIGTCCHRHGSAQTDELGFLASVKIAS